MDLHINDKSFVGIEYPGVIKNKNKMLETIGGEKAISKVYNDPNRRLDLRFRPEDALCKCLHGDRFNTTSLLIKIIRRRKKTKNEDSDNFVITKLEVVGTVDTVYKFRSMADFQFLPMTENSLLKTYESLLPSLIPVGLQPSSWLQEECPLIILPPLFSRLDTPSNYHFRKDPVQRHPKEENLDQDPNIIGRGRAKRSGKGQFISQDDPTPLGPTETAVNFFQSKGNYTILIEKITTAFEERPIFSRSALSGLMNLDYNRLKYVLPSVAYYFLNGPWRGLWVRFGYDPRKDSTAIKYQLLDLRVNITPGPGINFCVKRSIAQTKLTTKISNTQGRVGLIDTQSLTANSQLESPEKPSKSNQSQQDFSLRYVFREGELPIFRQVFYQLCDIQLESVQKLLSKEKGTLRCHERDGWCTPHFLEKSRDLMIKDVKKTADKIKKEHQKYQLAKEYPEEDEPEEEGNVNEENFEIEEDLELLSDLEDAEDDPDYIHNE